MKKTILVVEDEKSQRNALVEKLTHEGFEILEARDGEEGLQLALKHHPDLILLDVVMPKMDGVTMLKNLRQDTWGKTAAVVMLTNLNVDDKMLENIDLYEPSYYLVKADWKINDVVQKVRERLGDE